jgi:hypothetical protein
MKRSTIKKLLLTRIESFYHKNSPEFEILIDFIMEDIEKSGMLPPKAKFKDPGHFEGDEFEYESN